MEREQKGEEENTGYLKTKEQLKIKYLHPTPGPYPLTGRG